MTSEDRLLRWARMARHSLVYSSMMFNSRSARPLLVLIWTKS